MYLNIGCRYELIYLNNFTTHTIIGDNVIEKLINFGWGQFFRVFT